MASLAHGSPLSYKDDSDALLSRTDRKWYAFRKVSASFPVKFVHSLDECDDEEAKMDTGVVGSLKSDEGAEESPTSASRGAEEETKIDANEAPLADSKPLVISANPIVNEAAGMVQDFLLNVHAEVLHNTNELIAHSYAQCENAVNDPKGYVIKCTKETLEAVEYLQKQANIGNNPIETAINEKFVKPSMEFANLAVPAVLFKKEKDASATRDSPENVLGYETYLLLCSDEHCTKCQQAMGVTTSEFGKALSTTCLTRDNFREMAEQMNKCGAQVMNQENWQCLDLSQESCQCSYLPMKSILHDNSHLVAIEEAEDAESCEVESLTRHVRTMSNPNLIAKQSSLASKNRSLVVRFHDDDESASKAITIQSSHDGNQSSTDSSHIVMPHSTDGGTSMSVQELNETLGECISKPTDPSEADSIELVHMPPEPPKTVKPTKTSVAKKLLSVKKLFIRTPKHVRVIREVKDHSPRKSLFARSEVASLSTGDSSVGVVATPESKATSLADSQEPTPQSSNLSKGLAQQASNVVKANGFPQFYSKLKKKMTRRDPINSSNNKQEDKATTTTNNNDQDVDDQHDRLVASKLVDSPLRNDVKQHDEPTIEPNNHTNINQVISDLSEETDLALATNRAGSQNKTFGGSAVRPCRAKPIWSSANLKAADNVLARKVSEDLKQGKIITSV
jgi:hypothetical protein